MQTQYRGYTINASSLPMVGGGYRGAATITPEDVRLLSTEELLSPLGDPGYPSEDEAKASANERAQRFIDSLYEQMAQGINGKKLMTIEIQEIDSCPKCGEREQVFSELHPGTAYVRCDVCKHIGPEFMPKRDMSKQQEQELLAAVIAAWNTQPR